MATEKSYVTMLNEYTCRRKLTPIYQLISMEGMSHEPTFVYKVNVDGIEAYGRGRKKQEARQLAAMNLLLRINLIHESSLPLAGKDSAASDKSWTVIEGKPSNQSAEKVDGVGGIAEQKEKMRSDSQADVVAVTASSHVINMAPAIGPVSSNIALLPQHSQPENEMPSGGAASTVTVPPCRPENPVGSLQELTLSIRWPPPRFELVDRIGVAHDVTFVMACYVWSFKSLGRGKSKKLAKRLAAYNMYEILQAAPQVLELCIKRAEAYNKSAHQKNNRNKLAVPRRAPPLQDIHRDLMESSAESLVTLRNMSPQSIPSHPNPLAFLTDIATDLHFDILFDELFDLSRGPKTKVKAVGAEKFSSVLHPISENSTHTDVGVSDMTAASLLTLALAKQVVFFGTASSKSGARKAAAINALSYLHIASIPPKSSQLDGGTQKPSTQLPVS